METITEREAARTLARQLISVARELYGAWWLSDADSEFDFTATAERLDKAAANLRILDSSQPQHPNAVDDTPAGSWATPPPAHGLNPDTDLDPDPDAVRRLRAGIMRIGHDLTALLDNGGSR